MKYYWVVNVADGCLDLFRVLDDGQVFTLPTGKGQERKWKNREKVDMKAFHTVAIPLWLQPGELLRLPYQQRSYHVVDFRWDNTEDALEVVLRPTLPGAEQVYGYHWLTKLADAEIFYLEK